MEGKRSREVESERRERYIEGERDGKCERGREEVMRERREGWR